MFCFVDSLYAVKVGQAEVKTPAIEYYPAVLIVYLPQSAAMASGVTFGQQFPVKIDIAELQHAVERYDEFVIHRVSLEKIAIALSKVRWRFCLYE